jgi:hypothetical protein
LPGGAAVVLGAAGKAASELATVKDEGQKKMGWEGGEGGRGGGTLVGGAVVGCIDVSSAAHSLVPFFGSMGLQYCVAVLQQSYFSHLSTMLTLEQQHVDPASQVCDLSHSTGWGGVEVVGGEGGAVGAAVGEGGGGAAVGEGGGGAAVVPGGAGRGTHC